MLPNLIQNNLKIPLIIRLIVNLLGTQIFLKGLMDKPITILPLLIQQTGALPNQLHKPFRLFLGLIQLHVLQGLNLLTQLINQLIWVY